MELPNSKLLIVFKYCKHCPTTNLLHLQLLLNTGLFAGPFDVANKVVEFLMLRDGIDVCCTSDDDISLLRRYNDNFHS